MPFDGTDLGFSENHPLTKLGAVEWLLATKQLWCKFQLRDRDGRYCLVGAMEAVKARQVLEPIILRAAREVGGKHYWRIEFFNDDSRTSHADILRVLSLARENIVANIIKCHQRRSRPQRLAQAVRARWSGLVERAFKLAHKRAKGAVVFPQKFEDLFGLADADAQRIERKRRTHSGTTDDARAVERGAGLVPDEECAAELVFQRVDPGAHRRLGHMKAVGGADEIPSRDNGQKRSGEFCIQGPTSSCRPFPSFISRQPI